MSRIAVFTNAVVHTMVKGATPAEAVAFQDGKIIAVGADATAIADSREGAVVEDLGGRAVTPGFIDAHQHFIGATLQSLAVDCSIGAAGSIDEVLAALDRAARNLPEGAWLLGVGYDEMSLAENRHPTRAELDAACPHNPVLISHYTWHEGVANSRALKLASFGQSTENPPAGIVERSRRGKLTGRVIETAFSRVDLLAEEDLIERDTTRVLEGMRAYQNRLFAAGITRLSDATVPAKQEHLYRSAVAEGYLRMPVAMMASSSHGHLWPPWDRLGGEPTGHGPEELRVGHFKMFMDGANRCAMELTPQQTAHALAQALATSIRTRSLAALRGTGDLGFKLGRDLRVRSGVRYYEVEEARRLVARACESGFAVAIHAIGNAAVDQAIDALERAREVHPDSPPPRVEHATIITEKAARRAASAGIAVATQPFFVRLPALDELPKPPGLRFLAHRTLIDAGVRVAGSSDAPVTEFSPLDAMRAAVDRRTLSGARLQPEEAVTPHEALAMYTREAAFALGALELCGTLEPGKRADLVVLSEDPCSSRGGALDRARVERTLLAGEVVYSAAT